MAKRTVIEKWIDGTWNVICDTCGRKRKAFQCTMQEIPEMPNVFVCTETCLDKHNEQYDVTGVEDDMNVPVVRVDSNSNAPTLGDFCDGYTAALTYLNLTNNGVV